MDTQTLWVSTSDQQRLCVKTFGERSKPALVLVHGYPDHQEVWEPMIEHLVQHYFVLTYDVRGAGDSSIPKRIRHYALPRLSQDLAEVTEQVLGDKAFHLAAHDWGSIQSWESVTESKFRGRILSFVTISGPCLDHAAFWMRKQYNQNKPKFFKQLTKSWYIAVFQLPFLAPNVWRLFNAERWANILDKLEGQSDLPLNQNIAQDGQYGVGLYRANFIPRLLKPRQRYAVCPVHAIVLTQDNFVSPELIDEVPQWAEQFSRVEVDANHWAVLSQPEHIANLVHKFIQKHNGA
ncbi:alpha/beta hydrolase [Acinetobacter sp. NCu2D-2]|uniref:alpha/beta fold hydrolase n=1 Tax=Acinetobacter sp. NCu2D-2 TaxID=1608473 RepID=UPI0007CDFB88|nr:alpha/beta fold hydrolase [Acinetobacter sp. NCu2D-2]ANF80877.1 alpha/beta hydrolase [Acinetobacter sp. NCu2D-2]